MSPNRFSNILLPLFALCLSACASYPRIPIKYHRPPEKEIPDRIRSVGVFFEKAPDGLFSEGGMLQRLTAKFEQALLANGFYKIVDRSKLALLQAEMKLSFTDWATGKPYKLKIEGMDALIFGFVTKAVAMEAMGPITTLIKVRKMRPGKVTRRVVGHDANNKPIYREERGPAEVYYENVPTSLPYGRYVVVEYAVTMKMLDARTAQTYAIWDHHRSYDSRNAWTWNAQPFAVHPDQLPNPSRKLEAMINASIPPFLRQIAPYEVSKTVILIPGSPQSKQGITFAQNGMIEEAIKQFDLAARAEVPNDGALYNKGVMLEAMGDYRQAYEFYKQAYNIRQQALFLEAMKRMKKEIDIVEEQ